MFGPPGDQKSPLQVKCAVARCDLFNSNRVNITDACKAGITVKELNGGVAAADRFPSCCGSRKNQSSFFSMGDHPRVMGCSSQKRGFLNISVQPY